MVQQQLDQVTDSFGLADCQELLTFYLYFDQSLIDKTAQNVVKDSLICPRSVKTVELNLFVLH